MFLKIQGGQFVVTLYYSNYLKARPAVLLCYRCDTQRFLLAAASPACAEFEKNRNSLIVLRRNFPAETVCQ